MSREGFLTTRLAERSDRLHDLTEAVVEFLAAEDAVEAEAKRAEANGGHGWSSAPVVRRIYAVKSLRRLTEQTEEKK